MMGVESFRVCVETHREGIVAVEKVSLSPLEHSISMRSGYMKAHQDGDTYHEIPHLPHEPGWQNIQETVHTQLSKLGEIY
jgi:hypothetical protein